MRIEPLSNNPHFLPTIAQWYFREWGDSEYVQSMEEEVDKLKMYLNDNKIPMILTAVSNDTLLGLAQLKEREMSIYPDFQYWLGGVYVAKAFRNKGVAKALVLSAIEKARALNIQTLYLQTEFLNGGLYKALGWTKIEEVNYKNVDVLVMKRKTFND